MYACMEVKNWLYTAQKALQNNILDTELRKMLWIWEKFIQNLLKNFDVLSERDSVPTSKFTKMMQ